MTIENENTFPPQATDAQCDTPGLASVPDPSSPMPDNASDLDYQDDPAGSASSADDTEYRDDSSSIANDMNSQVNLSPPLSTAGDVNYQVGSSSNAGGVQHSADSCRPSTSTDEPRDYKVSQVEKNGKKQKVFVCTGFAPCEKDFTRLEHLNRHMRKHTGEKPFSCEICHRTFSRFDNMMQHRSTHNKDRTRVRGSAKVKNSNKKFSAPKKKRGRKPSPKGPKQEEKMNVILPPSPPQSRRGSGEFTVKHPIILPQPVNYHHFPSPEMDDMAYPRRSAPQVCYQPYPANRDTAQYHEKLPCRKLSILSQLAVYLLEHPEKSPEDFKDPPTGRLSVRDMCHNAGEEDAGAALVMLSNH